MLYCARLVNVREFHQKKQMAKMSRQKSLLAGLCFALLAAPLSGIACNNTDIAVDKLRSWVDGGVLHIVGRLINNCAQATGVKAKIILYNSAGDILKVSDPWLTGIDNIPAHSDFPFEATYQRQSDFSKFELRIISTMTWTN